MKFVKVFTYLLLLLNVCNCSKILSLFLGDRSKLSSPVGNRGGSDGGSGGGLNSNDIKFLVPVPKYDQDNVLHGNTNGSKKIDLTQFSAANPPSLEIASNNSFEMLVYAVMQDNTIQDVTDKATLSFTGTGLTISTHVIATLPLDTDSSDMTKHEISDDTDKKPAAITFRDNIVITAKLTGNESISGKLNIKIVTIPVCGSGYGRDGVNDANENINDIVCVKLLQNGSSYLTGSPNKKVIEKLSYNAHFKQSNSDNSNSAYRMFAYGEYVIADSGYSYPVFQDSVAREEKGKYTQFFYWCRHLQEMGFANKNGWGKASKEKTKYIVSNVTKFGLPIKTGSTPIGYWYKIDNRGFEIKPDGSEADIEAYEGEFVSCESS